MSKFSFVVCLVNIVSPALCTRTSFALTPDFTGAHRYYTRLVCNDESTGGQIPKYRSGHNLEVGLVTREKLDD